MQNLPLARSHQIVEQSLYKETLIYDLITNQAFNLNETLSIVYKSCDGQTSFDSLKQRYKFTDELIYLALDELKRNDLLVGNADYASPFAEISRREAIKKVGLASAVVLPVIAGLTAPKSIHAQSGPAACVFQDACSCTVTNNTGDPAFCARELGGANIDCGSNSSQCDCFIDDGGNTGTCSVFI